MHDNTLYRQINQVYWDNYELLMNSGLYQELIEEEMLIPHTEVDHKEINDEAYKIIKPEMIPFISYPYEWSFSQLKDAALLTLQVQKTAFRYNMVLKDASAYNIQFRKGKPVFIDTLSFVKYVDGEPWVAYKQFCQHFLAPLALMSYTDIRLNQLTKIYIDGIPVDLASTLLPTKTKINFSLLSHIHLHAVAQKKYEDKQVDTKKQTLNKTALMAMIDHLQGSIAKLNWQAGGTEWADYYDKTNYTPEGVESKKQFIRESLKEIGPATVWDLGANTGLFSRLASETGAFTISFDIDPAAVEKNYLQCLKKGEQNILPLLLDLTNPSPGIGWANTERTSFRNRGPVDMIFALALIHHLAISNNVPLLKIAEFFGDICKYLIIEFVPKSDSQVKRLLATREDVFPDYSRENFEEQFSKLFSIIKSFPVKDSERTIYLMRRK